MTDVTAMSMTTSSANAVVRRARGTRRGSATSRGGRSGGVVLAGGTNGEDGPRRRTGSSSTGHRLRQGRAVRIGGLAGVALAAAFVASCASADAPVVEQTATGTA